MKKMHFNIWFLFLISVTVIWGGGFVVVKWTLGYGLSAIMLNLIRFSCAAIIMFCLYFKNIFKLSFKQIGYGALTAFFMAVGFGAQTSGMLYTSSANAALITSLYVVLIPFMSWAFSKKRPAVKVFISAIVCFSSISLLSFEGATKMNFGDLLCFLSAIFFALHFIALGYTSKKMDSGALTFLQMFFSAVFFLIYATVFEPENFSLSGVSLNAFWCVAYLAVLSTAYAYIIQTKAQAVVSPSYASIILSCEGLFGAIFSIIFGLAPLSIFLAIGTIGVTFAVILVEYKPKTSLPEIPKSETPADTTENKI